MPQFISYIPIVTTLFSIVFAILIYKRYMEKGKGTHLLWWCFGVIMYGIGTFTESFVSLFGPFHGKVVAGSPVQDFHCTRYQRPGKDGINTRGSFFQSRKDKEPGTAPFRQGKQPEGHFAQNPEGPHGADYKLA